MGIYFWGFVVDFIVASWRTSTYLISLDKWSWLILLLDTVFSILSVRTRHLKILRLIYVWIFLIYSISWSYYIVKRLNKYSGHQIVKGLLIVILEPPQTQKRRFHSIIIIPIASGIQIVFSFLLIIKLHVNYNSV